MRPAHRQSILLILALGALYESSGCDAPQPARPRTLPVEPVGSRSTVKLVAAGDSEPDAATLDPWVGDWFLDVTEITGIDFICQNGREAGRFYLIESFGGGTALIDYDLDGDVDVFITGGGTISAGDPVRIGGRACPLYRNEGDFQFRDVTSASAFASSLEFTQGCAVSDFDVDGFPDLFVCGIGRSRLYRNQGDGTYEPVAEEDLHAPGWGTAAAFGDYNGDGCPDLLLARYTDWEPATDVECKNFRGTRDLCGPTSYNGTTSLLLHNSGNGPFEDLSVRAGLTQEVRGLGVVALDLNADGLVDFLVASDESPNRLYLGCPELPLMETADLAGVALGEWGVPQGNMGIGVADYNGDGHPDLFITNFDNEDDSLYRNLGKGLFVHASAAAGLSGLTRMRVGFGTAFSDFDGDGWPDLFIFNGSTSYTTGQTPFRQLPQLFRNVAGRRFEDVSSQAGTFFRSAHAGRGSAVGDLNGDGSLDLITVAINDRVRIQSNQLAPENFVSIRPVARFGERDATGARVWIDCDDRRQTQFVVRGTGFFSESDPRMIFPLSIEQKSITVTVAWPGRRTERFSQLQLRQTNVLIEGHGETDDELP